MAFFSAEYGDLKEWSKLLIGALVLITPIWLFDIFYFDRLFFNQTPIYLTIILSYILTLVTLMVMSFYGWIFLNTDKTKHENGIIYGGLLTLLLTLVCSGLAWYYKWTFRKLVMYYGISTVAVFPCGSYIFSTLVEAVKQVKANRERKKSSK